VKQKFQNGWVDTDNGEFEFDYPETNHPDLNEYDFLDNKNFSPMYGNNQNYNRGNNYSGGYSRGNGGGYNRGYNNGGNNGGQMPIKKHSGAKMGINQRGTQKGKQHIVFWNYSRQRGLISGIATPYKGTKEVKSKTSGRIWQNWMVSLQNKKTFQSWTTSGLFSPESGRLIIDSLGWVVNPKAKNGGYAGTFRNR
jgi:hypothetical protein